MPNKKKRAVLAGCGGISTVWLEALGKFDDVEITGLVDISPENAAARRREFVPDAAVGTDLKKMLDETKPDIVFDCTHPSSHHNVVITALKYGCHVLGEKPMAESMKEAAGMVKAARSAGKTYAVIQNRRYNRYISAFRNEITSGKAGGLTSLYADFFIGAHFNGFREQMDHVLLADMSVHTFDQARYISGKDPLYVLAYEWNPPGSWFRHGAAADCVFEMEDGVVFSYRGNWCAEGINTSWESGWRAVCGKGTLLWDGAEKITGEVVSGSSGFIRDTEKLETGKPEEIGFEGHAGVIREFLDSFENGNEPQTSCTDNIKSLAMVHAAVKSAKTGSKVRIKY